MAQSGPKRMCTGVPISTPHQPQGMMQQQPPLYQGSTNAQWIPPPQQPQQQQQQQLAPPTPHPVLYPQGTHPNWQPQQLPQPAMVLHAHGGFQQPPPPPYTNPLALAFQRQGSQGFPPPSHVQAQSSVARGPSFTFRAQPLPPHSRAVPPQFNVTGLASSVVVTIPKSQRKFIFGQGRIILNWIHSDSGATITILSDDATGTTFQISGLPQFVTIAKQMMDTVIRKGKVTADLGHPGKPPQKLLGHAYIMPSDAGSSKAQPP